MSETTEQLVTPDIIEQAMSYEEYRTMIDNLLSENKTTKSFGRNGEIHQDECPPHEPP